MSDKSDKMKQVIILREDLGMSPGKAAAQACHASIAAYEVSDIADIDEWKRNGVTKIVLGVHNEQALVKLYKLAVANELSCSLIADEGRTEISPGSITAVGIGPALASDIDEVTGHMHLYGKIPISEPLPARKPEIR